MDVSQFPPMNYSDFVQVDSTIVKMKLGLEKLTRLLAEHRTSPNPNVTDTMVVEGTEWITAATLAIDLYDNVKDKQTEYPGVVILMTKTLALPLLSVVK
jgi:hypothetical protein